jgi:hypothetical protein
MDMQFIFFISCKYLLIYFMFNYCNTYRCMRPNHLISPSVHKPFPTVAVNTNLFLGFGNQIKAAPRGTWFSQCAHVDTAARPLGTFSSRPAGEQVAPRPEAAIMTSPGGRSGDELTLQLPPE